LEPNEALEVALSLASQGRYVYPLAQNSKGGLRGTHAFKDASGDPERLRELFESTTLANVGVSLKESGLLVVDVDNHTAERKGAGSLLKLLDEGKRMPEDTYIEITPRGVHYFFEANTTSLSNKPVAFFPDSGIEIRTDHIVIAPSEVDGKKYDTHNSWSDIKPVPDWIMNELRPTQLTSKVEFPRIRKRNTSAGGLLDEIVSGVDEGGRNVWLTHIIGSLLASGMDPTNISTFMLVINQNYVRPPLGESEVKTIFNSILRREIKNNVRHWQ